MKETVLFVVIVLVFLRLSLAEILCEDDDFYLHFPNSASSAEVKTSGYSEIKAFSFCLWIQTNQENTITFLASNGFFFGVKEVNKISFSITDSEREMDITALDIFDDEWHGLCVSWENTEGKWMLFVDGRMTNDGSGLETGLTLTLSEFHLGVFSANFYQGNLSHVNLWPDGMQRPMLALLSSSCSEERGSLISWSQFRESVINNGVHSIEGQSCPSSVLNVSGLIRHWPLNGGEADRELSLNYSATFLEGRIYGYKALYLDQTKAFVTAPSFVINGSGFTFACWIRMRSPKNNDPTSSDPRIVLSAAAGASKIYQWDVTSNQLRFLRVSDEVSVSGGSLTIDIWQHIAVAYERASSNSLVLLVDGINVQIASSFSIPSYSTIDTYEIGRGIESGQGYRYFHGYISDFYVFERSLSGTEIGRIMGRNSPCTFSNWSPAPALPSQIEKFKKRNLTCPGVGQCEDKRTWRPANCKEALLAGNTTSAVYTISPENNEIEFDVYCDQETHGGGWLVIQHQLNGTLSFNRTWEEYKNGFGTISGQSNMWLGNEKIHVLTKKATELLIELEAFDGRKAFAIYQNIYLGNESQHYQLSVGVFSGSLADQLKLHSGAKFTTHDQDNDLVPSENCARQKGGGWWFTGCGEVILNSRYGQGGDQLMWKEFPDVGSLEGTIKITKMKLRSSKVRPGDYTVRTVETRSDSKLWHTILSEFKAFTFCLWMKELEATISQRTITLLQYKASNGNFTVGARFQDQGAKFFVSLKSGSQTSSSSIDYPLLDGSWHHLCVTWNNDQGELVFYVGGRQTVQSEKGRGWVFNGGGTIHTILWSQGARKRKTGYLLEISRMNLWDTVLSTNLVDECGEESGNILSWSSIAAISLGFCDLVPLSPCLSKEFYFWNFDQSTPVNSADVMRGKPANLSGGWISADRRSLVIEDKGYFLVQNLSSGVDFSTGFTISFSLRQTVVTSDILQDNTDYLEALRTAFPPFLRDYAVWKRCYAAGPQDWNTDIFHSSCDFKGPTVTVVSVREYVFGGFVEQSWGGHRAYIGNQGEAFLFSLSNPFNKGAQFLPILSNKRGALTDPSLGPSFGDRDLELFEDASGKLAGFSSLGNSYVISDVPLSNLEARNFFAGAPFFYPDSVEIFYYHVPTTPVGLETKELPDSSLTASSYISGDKQPYYARLNENRGDKLWCADGSTSNEYLQVNLIKQYTLTHIAIQNRNIENFNITREITISYVKAWDSGSWSTYEKNVDGGSIRKTILFNALQGQILKEAFIPPFEAVKIRLEIGDNQRLCLGMELYYFNAECQGAYGMENGSITDNHITASSTLNAPDGSEFNWPFRGRLNHDVGGGTSWSPMNVPISERSWLQVDLEREEEISCVATQGRHIASARFPKKYEVEFSLEGNDWANYGKTLTANSDTRTAVTNWLVPSVRGRFIRIVLTQCNTDCKLRAEFYGKRDTADNYMFQHGLAFSIRRGQYHIFFAKDNNFWEIRHPFFVNVWFEASLTWEPEEGLKFFRNGELVASDKSPEQLPATPMYDSFNLIISSEDGVGWSRSISVDNVSVRKEVLSEERMKHNTEVHLDFDDSSRNWTSLLMGSSWRLWSGCTSTVGTGPCNDTSGAGRYIYVESSYPRETEDTARFITPMVASWYQCVQFHYHMSGANIGKLSVYLWAAEDEKKVLWSVQGDQGDSWREGRIPFSISWSRRVVFEAVRGSGHLGDIAIDDIFFSRDNCSLSPSEATLDTSSGVVVKSSIVRMNTIYHGFLDEILRERHDASQWIPCYHALTDGWDVFTFHRKCDNKGPTLTIVRKDNFVFGGFTERSWKESDVDASYELYFPRKSGEDYVQFDWPTELKSDIEQFTITLWLKTLDQGSMAIFSYKKDLDTLDLTISNNGLSAQMCILTFCGIYASLRTTVSDGFWHHIAVVWIKADGSWELFVDGIREGKLAISDWRNYQMRRMGTFVIGQKIDVFNVNPFESPYHFHGRITFFNMWDQVLTPAVIYVLALSCAGSSGNVIKWERVRSASVAGQPRIMRPSSCSSNSSKNYQSDPNAFIFSFNYTAEGPLFLKGIRDEASSVAIYSSNLTGPAFGEAPFDIQVGINGTMRRCTSNHEQSYTENQNSAFKNLGNVFAGAPLFSASDIEVLYKSSEGSLCVTHCPYNHECELITGNCRCKTLDSFPGLCNLASVYRDCTHFWPLDSLEEIEDLRTPGWGKAAGGVALARGLGNNAILTDGVSGIVQLNTEGKSCATKALDDPAATCVNGGFTVALWIKYWNRADGHGQMIFQSLGKFFVFISDNKSSLTIRTQESFNDFCLKEIEMPEGLWTHLAFSHQSSPQTLTVYRNGKIPEEAIIDHGCTTGLAYEALTLSLASTFSSFFSARASYDDVVIWDSVQSAAKVAHVYNVYAKLKNFSVTVVVKMTNRSWHNDLTSKESERYKVITGDLTNNITNFYSKHTGLQVSVKVQRYRQGSVIADLSIFYSIRNYSLIEELNISISETGYLESIPLEIISLIPDLVPSQAPTSLSAYFVNRTTIGITWQPPSFSDDLQDVFQGYKVYVSSVTSGRVDIITVNELANSTFVAALTPATTYNISIAAYTLIGVGKESEPIAVNTSVVPTFPVTNLISYFVNRTTIGITWEPPQLSQYDQDTFQGYRVFIRTEGNSEVKNITADHQLNHTLLEELNAGTTYNISILAYTLTITGIESEVIIEKTNEVPTYPITNLTTYFVNASCIGIEWNPPNLSIEEQGIFQGYTVFIRSAENSEVTLTTVGKTNHTLLKNLNAGTTYNISIIAYTRLIAGKESDVMTITTLIVASSPPISLKANNVSSTAISVEWELPPPEEIYGVFLGLRILFRPYNQTSSLWSTQFACPVTLNTTIFNLERYVEYEIVVSLYTSLGLGTPSVIRCFTDEDVPKSGPVNIRAYNTSSTSIYIHWSPVPQSVSRGVILLYLFNLTEVPTGEVSQVYFDGNVFGGEVTNLTKYTEYAIIGAIVNSKGRSNFTNETRCHTAEDVPDFPPTNVTAYNTSSNSIMVEFQSYSSKEAHGVIREYNVRYFIASQSRIPEWLYRIVLSNSKRKRRAVAPGVMQVNVKGLEEYTTYSIQVSVVTIHEGPRSSVINVSTDEGVPRAFPLQLTAFNTSNTSIFVNWEHIPPSSVPGILLGYELRYIRADDTNASNFVKVRHGLVIHTHLTNLESFTLYNISVAGYSRVGRGDFSQTQCWTDEGVPLGPPINITGNALSMDSLIVSWLPVSLHLRSGIIQGYDARIYDIGGILENQTVCSVCLSATFGALMTFTNYTVQVRAFTRIGPGPWSLPVNVSTGVPAPDEAPVIYIAEATGPTSIHVTWDGVSNKNPLYLHGYRVRYHSTKDPYNIMYFSVGRNTLDATITMLLPFTLYKVEVAAFSTREGNYSAPVFSKTWEGTPSAPPSFLAVTVQNSHGLLVHWLDVPPDHRHGIIRGYGVTYEDVYNGTRSTFTVSYDTFSVVLTPLRKATRYDIYVWAFTSAGEGKGGYLTAVTSEDAPSGAPVSLTAQNHTSLTQIPVSWEPVPPEYMNGQLTGYIVTYQAVRLGDLPIDFEPVFQITLGPTQDVMLLDLEALVVYRITVAAVTSKGPGPEAVTFGETCRCRRRLTTNWRNYHPYVNLTSLGNPGIIIPLLLDKVVRQCCSNCQEHGPSIVDFKLNGRNKTAEQKTAMELLRNIGEETDFSFPVIGHKLQDSYKGGLGYAPFVESAGVAFVVYIDLSSSKEAMFTALLQCWPVILLPMVMAYLAGVVLWVLDAKSENPYFSGSFIYGTWEGVWWSFVSMTTVGYGDRTPVSAVARMFAIAWVLVGLVIISVTMGALTTALTVISADSEPTIYGSKLGAIQDSPEYNLGRRRNAIMNQDKEYHTLEELSEALLHREVEGVLVDTYAGGTRKELFTKPQFRVARIIDYQSAYGVVIGGPSMRLRHCFYGYMRAHQADIFEWVEELVNPISGSEPSEEELAQEVSTGLFDSDAKLFHDALLISSVCTITAVFLGLTYELVRVIRRRAKVQDKRTEIQNELDLRQLRSMVENSIEQLTSMLCKMKRRHKSQILEMAKKTVGERKYEKAEPTMSSTSGVDSKMSVVPLDAENCNFTGSA